MRKLFLLLILLQVFFARGQKINDPKIFADLITPDKLKKQLYIIAGKDFEGRETGSEGQRKAAAYIENYFRSLKLQQGNKDSYQMRFPVYQDSLEVLNISIDNHHFNIYKDVDASLSANYTSLILGSEVVFAGYGISEGAHDDYKGLDVKGKIVMVLDGYQPDVLQDQLNKNSFNPYGKQGTAQMHGAIALLSIKKDFPHPESSRKSIMYLNPFKAVNYINTYYISEEIARSIMGKDYDTAKNGHVQPKSYNANIVLQFIKSIALLQSSNVMGYLEGTDLKDQLLIISAHYDHLGKKDSTIYYGADDDGSGTVSVLEIASAFAQAKAAGAGPRRSILFLAHSGEEEGLWGSQYYTASPPHPLANTTADLNIDMIGRIDPTRKRSDTANYIYVVGDNRLSSDLHPIIESTNKKFTQLKLDYKFNDPKDPERIFYRSDHYSFASKGVPVVFFYDGSNKDYHKPTDTPDKINYELLANRAKLVFYSAWEIANRDNMLARDIPLGD
ncbi:MAG: M28 family peptidase [Bacteroidetes bacterium]|nr:M28 family peptidase [Bacteroidota bacterium]